MNIVIFLLAGAAALGLLCWSVALFFRAARRETEEDFADRLEVAGQAAESDDGPERLFSHQVNNPALRFLCHQFWAAGFQMKPVSVLNLLLLWLLFSVLVIYLTPLFGLLLSITLLLALYLYLLQRKERRRNKITGQLPLFLEYVMRALTAGNSLEESIYDAAKESPEPTRSLFLRVSRQVRYGAPVEDVLAEQGDINGLRELEVMAMAARVNRRYGGSMKRVVKSVIDAIRQRESAARELRALTAETRISAVALGVIPILIIVVFVFLSPGYYSIMWQYTGSTVVVVVGVLLQLVGIFLIWRMMSFAKGAA